MRSRFGIVELDVSIGEHGQKLLFPLHEQLVAVWQSVMFLQFRVPIQPLDPFIRILFAPNSNDVALSFHAQHLDQSRVVAHDQSARCPSDCASVVTDWFTRPEIAWNFGECLEFPAWRWWRHYEAWKRGKNYKNEILKVLEVFQWKIKNYFW